MTGTDHGQHFALGRVVHFAQARCHVAVALADDGVVQGRALAGELAEAGFEHIALLELLDLVFAHFLGGEQASAQAHHQLDLAEEAQALRGTPEGQADLAVDQVHGQVAFVGQGDRALELGTRLDLELFGQAALVGGQGQVGGEQGDAALADHLDQVELGQRIRIGQCLQALRVQFDRDRIEAATFDRTFHRFDAGLRDVRGAQQGVAHAIAFDDADGLAGEQRVAGVNQGIGHCIIHSKGRCRHHRRARAASGRYPASGHACGRGRGKRRRYGNRNARAV
ncbi:hypothetical protein D3C71_1325560 [compost metagenome]